MANILDLSTFVERRSVKIDGDSYELFNPDEISPVQSDYITHFAEKYAALAEDIGDDDLRDEIESRIVQMVLIAVKDVPKEVIEKLSPRQRWAIVEVFTQPSETRAKAEPKRKASRKKSA